jgi:hypothetical protein
MMLEAVDAVMDARVNMPKGLAAAGSDRSRESHNGVDTLLTSDFPMRCMEL